MIIMMACYLNETSKKKMQAILHNKKENKKNENDCGNNHIYNKKKIKTEIKTKMMIIV